MSNSSPQSQKKVCRRCNKKVTDDIICASCKNELLSMYDSKSVGKQLMKLKKLADMLHEMPQ